MCAITEHVYACCNTLQIAKQPCPMPDKCIWVYNVGQVGHELCNTCRIMQEPIDFSIVFDVNVDVNFDFDFDIPALNTSPVLALEPVIQPRDKVEPNHGTCPYLPTAPLQPSATDFDANETKVMQWDNGVSHIENAHRSSVSVIKTEDLDHMSDPVVFQGSKSFRLPIRSHSPFSTAPYDPVPFPVTNTQPTTTAITPPSTVTLARLEPYSAPPTTAESCRHVRPMTARLGEYVVERRSIEEANPREVAGHSLRPNPRPTKKSVDGWDSDHWMG